MSFGGGYVSLPVKSFKHAAIQRGGVRSNKMQLAIGFTRFSITTRSLLFSVGYFIIITLRWFRCSPPRRKGAAETLRTQIQSFLDPVLGRLLGKKSKIMIQILYNSIIFPIFPVSYNVSQVEGSHGIDSNLRNPKVPKAVLLLK